MLLRNAWYIAAWADELGSEPLARRICNDPVVLFRDGAGKVGVLADRCCHRAAPLHRGSVVEAGIQCGYHGLVFDGSGHCIAIPGQTLIPEDARVRVFTVAYDFGARGALTRIAQASKGRFYDATSPLDISDVLRDVISNF